MEAENDLRTFDLIRVQRAKARLRTRDWNLAFVSAWRVPADPVNSFVLVTVPSLCVSEQRLAS